ncbi:hypothetical protein NHX12_025496 [Muraenolepis orangiensis]|uniref:SAM domain-containing protein n=1 Tax=Muraenolepis orangiensis TaxID=630683 RepID=A0A9Q0EJK4_9TELE|nr:hypothetical protein NHX12_025496 [Muraenolepis orangiensis]
MRASASCSGERKSSVSPTNLSSEIQKRLASYLLTHTLLYPPTAQTPIEEFTPTPAFPALQYLESVDEGGVAWRAGLRMGDFLIEGGNSLMVKVVMVARNPEMEDTSRKKAPQPAKRLTPPAIALRSKSMTSELEDMATSPWKKKAEYEPSQVPEKKRTVYQMALNKLDEILAAAQQTITPEGHGQRSHGGKRDRSKSIVPNASNEMGYEQQSAVAMVQPMQPGFGFNQAQFQPGQSSQHAVMMRQKSIGVTEEERQYLHPPAMKLARSLSVPGPEEIPPPPNTSAPEPPLSAGPIPGRGSAMPIPPVSQPHYQLHSQPGHVSQAGWERGVQGGVSQPPQVPTVRRPSEGLALYGREHEVPRRGGGKMSGMRRGYSSATPPTSATSKRGGRGALTKQSKVEDGLRLHRGKGGVAKEKSSISVPTIIVKQNAENLDYGSHYGTAFPGAVGQGARRDRERFRDMRRKSASFFLSSEEDIQGEAGGGGESGGAGGVRIQPLQVSQMDVPTPRLRPSKSIDEGMFSGDNYVNYANSMPPAFGLPEYSSPILSQDGQPRSAPSSYGPGSQPTTTFIHPLTGKVLDPSSPLGLALAARERALKDDRRTRREDRHFGRQMSSVGAFTTPVQTPTPSLFATPTQSAYTSPVSLHLTSPTATASPASLKDRTNQYQSQFYPQSPRERERDGTEGYDVRPPQPIQPPAPPTQQAPRRPSFLQMENTTNPSYVPQYTVPTAPPATQQPGGEAGSAAGVGGLGLMVLPPPAPSIDIEEEFVFADPLPPPLQFANGESERLHKYHQHQQRHQQLQNQHRSAAPPPPPPPLPSSKSSAGGPGPGHAPQSSSQAGDSAASSLTSYDSEVANLTQSALSPSLPSPQIFPPSSSATTSASAFPAPSLHRPQPLPHNAGAYAYSGPSNPPADSQSQIAMSVSPDRASSDYTVAMPGSRQGPHNPGKPSDPHTHPAALSKGGDWQEAVVDSGIEELDSHSSSDHHLEMLGMTHYKEAGGRAPPVALRRQCSTNPASVQPQRQTHVEEDIRREGPVAEERKRRLNRNKAEGAFGSTLAACLDRPVDGRTVGWGETVEPDRAGGGLHRGGISHEGRRLHSPLSGVKASIINELSSKLQQMGNVKSMDDWSHAPKSPTMHRYSADFSDAFHSPPTGRPTSPLPTSSPQHHQILGPTLSATPSMSPSAQVPVQRAWARSPSPQMPTSPVHSHPPLSPTYAPYPTSPKHRSKFRRQTFDFQCGPSQEMRPMTSRRRAPSPLIYATDQPGPAPPRPSSLPILPSTPAYSHPFDFPSPLNSPSPGHPLGDVYNPSTPPLFSPSGVAIAGGLLVSRSLSPTQFLSGTASPMHLPPSPSCLSYPHLMPPPPAKPFAVKPLPYWSKYDVADWLAYLNLAEHRERFLDNEIDGSHLPSLTKDDFLDLGVTRVGHRMNIERALKSLTDR